MKLEMHWDFASLSNLQNAFWADTMLLAELFPELEANLISALPQLEHHHLARHVGLLSLCSENVRMVLA